MKKNDLVKHHQESDSNQLEKIILELQAKIIDLRLQKELGQVKNVHQEQSLKKDIAKLKTIIKMKQISINTNNTSK